MPELTTEDLDLLEDSEGMSTDELDRLEANDEPFVKPALGLMQGAIRSGSEAIGTIGQAVDKVTGAPIRSAVSAGLKGERMDKAMLDQLFLKPAAAAPSGKDIAAQLGMSTDETVRTPFMLPTGGYMKASPAGLAGTAAEVVLDPTTYIPPLGAERLAGAAIRRLPEAVDTAGKAARSVGKRAANVLGGVDEQTFEYYMKNSKRIKAGKDRTIEDIKDIIDKDASEVLKDADIASSRRKTLEEQLTGKSAAMKKELEGQSTSIAEAREIMSDLEQEKALLGSLSEQADDALARSDIKFKRDDLLGLIDQTGSEIGPHVIGEETTAAVNALMRTRDRVAGLPDVVNGPELRSILKQIRKDVDFDLKAGQFNSELNAARKRIAGSISGVLKDVSPEYSAYMNRMAKLADSLEGMSRHFGDEAKGIASMEAVRGGKSGRGQVVEDVLKRYADTTGRRDILDKLKKFEENRERLRALKEKGGDKKLFSGEAREIEEATADEAMAMETAAPAGRLTSSRTQSIIRNQGGMVPSIEDRRALEGLGKASGTDYQEMIKDRSVLDSFSKDRTRGSRGAVMGGTAGSAVGYAAGGPTGASIGAGVGAWAGGAADKYSGRISQTLMDRGMAAKDALDVLARQISAGGGQYAKYRKILEKSAGEGTRSLVVTHHLLMNNDPEYRKLFEGRQ